MNPAWICPIGYGVAAVIVTYIFWKAWTAK